MPGNSPEDKTPIKDFGKRPAARIRVVAALSTVLASFAMGVAIGLFVKAMLVLMNLAIDAVWTKIPYIGGTWWAPLAICPLGGLLIGWWNARFHAEPDSLEEVMRKVKKDGGYRVGNVPAAIVSFLMPLAFGGSVGPEAGLSGFIAGGATRISASLRRAGIKVRSLSYETVPATISAVFGAPFAGLAAACAGVQGDKAQEFPDLSRFTYRKAVKAVLYAVAAGGAFLGVWVSGRLLGGSIGLPRLEGAQSGFSDIRYILPCIACGYILALVFALSSKGFSALSLKLKGHETLAGLLAGVVMGAAGSALPYSLFSGESQIEEILQAWQGLPALTLFASAMVKGAVTPCCISLGWKGGSIFPCIFCGISLGLGIASLTGADAMLCAICSCGAFLGAKTRKPALAVGILLLCVPLKSIVWLFVAALVGAYIPQPKALREGVSD